MTNSDNTIIILPFISNIRSTQVDKVESTVILALEYKFSSFKQFKILDLKSKKLPPDIKSQDNSYKISDLIRLSKKYNAKYAIVFKFLKDDNSHNKLILDTQLFNLSIAENIENWQAPETTFCFDNDEIHIQKDNLNTFLTDSIKKISSKTSITYDEDLTNYIEKELINSIPALLDISQAIKQTKDTNKKIELLQSSINKDPHFEFSYFELAKLYNLKKNYPEAITNFNIAIEKAIIIYKKALYYNYLGTCYSLNKEFEKAIDAWKTAISLKPKFINPYINLAMAYEEKEAFNEAEKYFIKLQVVDPTDCRSYFSLARLYSKTGDWLKAIDQYKKQIEIKPQDAWSHSNIANCYMQIGKNKEAKTFFYQTIKLDPDGEAGNFAKQILEALDESTKKDWWKFWRK